MTKVQRASVLFAMTFLLLGSTIVYGQPPNSQEIPRDVRQTIESFLKAVNSGDPVEIAKFVRASHHPRILERVPEEVLVNRLVSFHRQFGPLEARQFKGSSNTSAMVWTRGRLSKAWVGFGFFFEKDGPRRLMSIGRDYGPTPPAEERLVPATSPRQLTARMNKYLDGLAGTPFFSGSVLIAHKGRPILERSLGMASVRYGVPNRNHTIYLTASISKMFVAVAIAQLEAKGALSYQDPMSKFLPEYPKHIANQVTLHHLLTHTSGIELDEISDFVTATRNAGSIRELIELQIKNLPKLKDYENFKRTEEFDYTNEGYALLARIVEVVSGQSYFDYLRNQILKPAGMYRTGGFYRDSPPRNSATGYTSRVPPEGRFVSGPPRENTDWLDLTPPPHGGLASTTSDLLRFANALFEGKLLKQEAVQTLTSSKVNQSEKVHYGYGFQIVDTLAGRCIGHDGAKLGFSSRLDHYLESGYTIIVLSNQDHVANNVADLIRELLSHK